MGLASASKGVDAVGVPRFDATSMVAWREKQTLRRMNEEEFTHAQVQCLQCVSFLLPKDTLEALLQLLTILTGLIVDTSMSATKSHGQGR